MIATVTKATPFALICALCASMSPCYADEPLLLVKRSELLKTPPSQTLQGQTLHDMHLTSLSRTALVTLSGLTQALSHDDGERTLIVLKGSVTFNFANQQRTLSAGDYVAIAAGQGYQMVPIEGEQALLLDFEVPLIDMAASRQVDLSKVSSSATPVIKLQRAVMASPTSWDDSSDRGWTLAKTADKRVNLVEMRSELKRHSHPDADHSLILLQGSARVVTPREDRVLKPGDYVSIPRNVAHKYYVEGDRPALFISFDAPAYDPAKTVYFE